MLFLGLGRTAFGFTVGRWAATLAGLAACAGCGLVLAVFSMGMAFLKRSEAHAFIYAFPDAIAVVSGVFYTTAVFPAPVRMLAQTLPTTHAFNLLKATLGQAPWRPGLCLATLAAWGVAAVAFTSWAL